MSEASGERPPQTAYWVHFVRAVPFIMLCGIVGPIFLVMGLFAEGPVMGWMVLAGLVITAGNLALAAGTARGAHRVELKRARLAAYGRMGRADILSMDDTTSEMNGHPVVVLRLRIHGDYIVPFEVEDRVPVPLISIPLLHRGPLAVRVDPETQEYEVDWKATAQLEGPR